MSKYIPVLLLIRWFNKFVGSGFNRNNLAALAAFSAMMLPQPAFAAGLNGGELSFVWAVPFIGVLLCIAICPLVVPNFWHHHFGKVAVFWALACAVP